MEKNYWTQLYNGVSYINVQKFCPHSSRRPSPPRFTVQYLVTARFGLSTKNRIMGPFQQNYSNYLVFQVHEHLCLLMHSGKTNGHTSLVVLGHVTHSVGIKHARKFLYLLHNCLGEASVNVLLPSGVLRPQQSNRNCVEVFLPIYVMDVSR